MIQDLKRLNDKQLETVAALIKDIVKKKHPPENSGGRSALTVKYKSVLLLRFLLLGRWCYSCAGPTQGLLSGLLIDVFGASITVPDSSKIRISHFRSFVVTYG